MNPPLKYPLCQQDARWASVLLGDSTLTVGRYGCTTTAICNGLRYFGIFITPDQFAHNADNYTRHDNPQGGGLVDWPHFQLPGGFTFVKRIGSRTAPVRDDAAITASLKDPNQFVILEVANGSHWVLALRRTLFGNDYRIEDSWHGDCANAVGRYRNITGSAHFARPVTR